MTLRLGSKGPQPMTVSPRGLAEIAGHEGIVAAPYLDSVGVLTWGIGHTAAAGSPDPADLPAGIEQPTARILDVFRQDMAKFEADVNRAVTVPLAQHEFDALVSFHFNTGGIFRANLTKRLNAGDRPGAIKGFDGWHKPPEIIGRRNSEKRLFAEGVYAHGGKALVIPVVNRRPQYSKGRQVDVLAVLGAPSMTDVPFLPPPDLPRGREEPVPGPVERQPDDPGPQGTPAAETGFWGLILRILRRLGLVQP